jgi:hypothetical protein
LDLQASKTEIGEVAVTHCNAAELASKRSIEAIRRPKIPVDGGKLAEAFLDILVTFLVAATRCVLMGPI